MVDELTVCAAAFFRSIGKDFTTSNEFVMVSSLELKWMPPSDSKLLLRALLSRNILTQRGEFIRPAADLSAIDLPLAYKPSPELIESLHSAPAPPKKEADPDTFHILVEVAKENGIQTKDFVPACSRIQKRLDIDISAAALLVLRDNGVNIAPYVEKVRSAVTGAERTDRA